MKQFFQRVHMLLLLVQLSQGRIHFGRDDVTSSTYPATTTFADSTLITASSEGPEAIDECECATSHFGQAGKIVGGDSVKVHSVPYQALLSIFGATCGATVINQNFLVTARHCFFQMDNLEGVLPEKDVFVVAGLHNQCDIASEAEHIQVRHIKRVILPDGPMAFNEVNLENDIVLLELNAPLNFSTAVQPACLPRDDVRPGDLTWVSGWGSLLQGGPSPCELQYVDQVVLSEEQCNNTDLALYMGGSLPYCSMFCAGFDQGGKDSCQGDSGGPLIRVRPDHKVELVGIVSWGMGCAQPGYPGVYTRVFKYLKWIRENIQGGYDGAQCRAPLPDGSPDQVNDIPLGNHLPDTWSPRLCVANWIGDGFCDDGCNQEFYQFDLGDCCLKKTENWDNYCTVCQCHPSTCLEQWLNDTVCHDGCNRPEWGFDGNDCCFNTAVGWDRECEECRCLDEQAIRQQCDTHLKGDGLCQDECNTAQFFFDDGDCCNNEADNWDQMCRACQCLEPIP